VASLIYVYMVHVAFVKGVALELAGDGDYTQPAGSVKSRSTARAAWSVTNSFV
jgi:hypothetical protein